MIRTTFSLLTLCAGLYLTGWLIHETDSQTSQHLPQVSKSPLPVTPGHPFTLISPELVQQRLERAPRGHQQAGGQPVRLPETLSESKALVHSTVQIVAYQQPLLDPPGNVDFDSTPVQSNPNRPLNDAITIGGQPAEKTPEPSTQPSTQPTTQPATEPTTQPTHTDDQQLDGEPSVIDGEFSPAPTQIIPVAPPQQPLTPELVRLREDVRDCLGYYYNQPYSATDHSPWGIMHVLIAYGVDTDIIVNDRKMNAIGWLCWNGSCRGQQLFYMENGRLQTRLGPGVQGHAGQFLAMMAQSRIKSNYPMRVDGRELTLEDLIRHEQWTCQPATELTFKLIGLSHYLDTDTEWRNQNGEKWNIARLIKEELAQPVVGAACGGTHRMMGFNYAVRKREKEGKPVDGQFNRAKIFLKDYFEYTFYLQNDDGSFSTDFFRGRNGYGDADRRLETTGHILEWFVASLDDEQLRDPRVIKAVRYLTNLMLQNRNKDWAIGPRGHALHGLAIYAERVFEDKPGSRDTTLARGRRGVENRQR